MEKLKIFVFLAIIALTFLSPFNNVIADAPGNIHHHNHVIKKPSTNTVKVLPDTTHELDTASSIIDTVNNQQFQDNLNFLNLIEPQHLATGGAVFVVVIFSFVVLSKIRNKNK